MLTFTDHMNPHRYMFYAYLKLMLLFEACEQDFVSCMCFF